MNVKNNRKFYDEAFLEIFSNRQIVESLLRDFVREQWVDSIDFASLKTEKSVFKGISESKRASDLLLQFDMIKNTTELSSLYIYILIEFQSTSKPVILRVLEYLVRIYKRQMIKNKVLFPVIPMVIYNGKENWRERKDLREHFAVYTDEISKYLPLFEYYLVDVVRLDDKLLERLKSAAADFFLLDKTDLKQREKAEKRIIGILKRLIRSNPEIYNLLGRYISALLSHKGLENRRINDYINDRGESMLAQSLDELYEQGLEQGIEQGIEKDKKETALRMLDDGVSIDVVAKYTELPKEIIKELRKTF